METAISNVENSVKQENCGISFNKMQMLSILSSYMYKGDIVKIAFKELHQNAFDAVKKNHEAMISFTTNCNENYIECMDNGIGMSPDTVRDVFLTVGGTLKDGLENGERSGGLGIAKVQFIMSAARIQLETVKDGIRTMFDTTQADLLDDKTTMISEPSGTKKSGTRVRLYFPKEIETLEGKTIKITVPSVSWMCPDVLRKPLVGYSNVKILFNGNEITSNMDSYTHSSTFEFSWGTVIAYYDPKKFGPNENYYQIPVHSAGLFQFNTRILDSHYNNIKFPVIIDIKPKVKAGENGYPFNNSREGFNSSVSEDMKNVYNTMVDIQSALNSQYLQAQFSALEALSYMEVDGTNFEDKTFEQKSANLNWYTDEFLDEIAGVFLRCPSVYKTNEYVETKNKEVQIAASKATEVDKNNLLKLKNDTTGLYQDSYTLFSKYASIILDSFNLLGEEYTKKDNTPNAFGVILNKEMHGALLSGTQNILWMNPLSCQHNDNAECWSRAQLRTFIHECSHINKEYHDEYFISEMDSLEQELIYSGKYNTILGKFRALYDAYTEDIQRLSIEFITSNSKKS